MMETVFDSISEGNVAISANFIRNAIPVSSIELFCGAGGLALGLQKTGFSHHALYEWDKDSCDNINSNIKDGLPIIQGWNVFQKDVRAVKYDGLTGKIHMVSGGPPCQPFSLGGKAMAYNDTRDMFPEAVRAVREIRPEVFIFENVRGLVRKSFSRYFSYIILQLTYPSIVRKPDMSWEDHRKALELHHMSKGRSSCEYNVSFRLLNAADYGVPQQRHRVIIVGFRGDLNADWVFPRATHSKEALLYSKWISHEYWDRHGLIVPDCPLTKAELRNVQNAMEGERHAMKPWQTTRDAIGDLPDPRSVEALNCDNHHYRGGAKIYAGHTGSLLDEPSKTIKAGAHGVPGGENAVVLDSGEIRYYTVRESARIQTFPDSYKFYASWTESMRQIGNAVPVRLAEVIGASVRSYLWRAKHE